MARMTKTSTRKRRFDIAAILLAPFGVAVVLLSQYVDGGSGSALVQGPAALIVLGGTLGAVPVRGTVWLASG